MSERIGQPWEDRLRDTARALHYPSTPDLVRGVTARLREDRAASHPRGPGSRPHLRIGVVVLALFLLSLLAVPDVRATIGTWLRLGSVEIVVPTPTPLGEQGQAPPMPPTALQEIDALPVLTPTPHPRPVPTPLASVLDLAGEMTLEEAARRVSFPIKLPTYPQDLGPPDRVFVQEFGGPVAILVWIEPGTRDQVRMSLHLLGFDTFARKFANEFTQIAETTVNGERALWMVGPHMLSFYEHRSGSPQSQLVTGHVLIWEAAGTTYRLETELPLEEAVRIAESVR